MLELVIAIITSILLPLAVIGGIAYGIYVLWNRRRRSSGPDTGLGTPRRFYFYSISFVGLGMLVSGVTIVLLRLFDTLKGEPVLSESTTVLASGLALVIVGLPLWGLHWRFIQRSVAPMPDESSTILRRLYVSVTLGVALGFLVFNGIRLVEVVLFVRSETSFMWSALLVGSVVWGYHWYIALTDGRDRMVETVAIRRLYLYLASVAGVALLAVGVGLLLYSILAEGYSEAFGVQIISSGDSGLFGDTTRSSLALIVVGCVITWSHWLRFVGEDRQSVLRWLFLFVVSIGGGVVTALIGCGIVLVQALTWVLGGANDPAIQHFDDIPAALSSIAVGVIVWRYFRRQIIREAQGDDAETVRRSYDHLLSAIGLALMAVACASLLDMAFRMFADDPSSIISDGETWQFRIAFVVSFFIIGIPLWATYWTRLQAAAVNDPVSERTALSRKLYVLSVLCLGVLALVGSASASLFILLRDLLDANLSLSTLTDMETALAVILTTAIILPYHWIIYRQDRVLEPDEEQLGLQPVRKDVLVLSAAGGSEFVASIEDELGYPVTSVHWTDADAFVPIVESDLLVQLSEAVESAPGQNVILIPDDDGLRIVSYR